MKKKKRVIVRSTASALLAATTLGLVAEAAQAYTLTYYYSSTKGSGGKVSWVTGWDTYMSVSDFRDGYNVRLRVQGASSASGTYYNYYTKLLSDGASGSWYLYNLEGVTYTRLEVCFYNANWDRVNIPCDVRKTGPY